MQELYKSLGLDDERFKLSWISASEGQKFARVSGEYTDTITKKGKNPTKNNIFL